MFDIKNLDLNKIKIDQKSYKIILVYYIEYVTVKYLSHVAPNSVNRFILLSIKQMVTLKNVIEITKKCGRMSKILLNQ